MVKHYRGDDSDLKLLMAAVPKAFESVTVEEYDRRVQEFFGEADNPGAEAAIPRMRLSADGRAAALSGGQQLYHLHCLWR